MSLAIQTQNEPEPTFQLIYISAANHNFTEDELGELLTVARANNEKMNVSGMLLYHAGSFIQALEGAQSQVEFIYEKIGRDKRHTETRVLHRGEAPQRDFDGWSMGFYRSAQSSAENLEGFHQFLIKGFQNNDDGVNGSEARSALLEFREGKLRQHVDS